MLFRLIGKFKKSKSGALKSAFFSLVLFFGFVQFASAADCSIISGVPCEYNAHIMDRAVYAKDGSVAAFWSSLYGIFHAPTDSEPSAVISCTGEAFGSGNCGVEFLPTFHIFFSGTSITFGTLGYNLVDSNSENTVIFQNGSFSLSVVSPQLNQNYRADVQPSATFKVLLHYNIPVDKFSSTQFALKQCDSFDENSNCVITHTGTISEIRAGLVADDNSKNSIFVEVPVVLDQYTILFAELGDISSQKIILATPFVLHGVANSSLPSSNSATLSNGQVQDLGFWGNLFRDLFVPTPEFMTMQTNLLYSEFSNKFPALASLQLAVNSGVNSLFGAPTTFISPTISMFGAENMQVIKIATLDPYMGQFKSWISIFLWFYCAVFCIKFIRNLLSPGQIQVDL